MTINISFNSGLHNVDSFEINGNTEYGSYASFETEDSTFTLGNISCNGDIAESLTITDPNYSSYSDSISSQYDTFIISTAEGTYTIDVDSVFTSVFTVTASANDCDLGDVYVDDVSNRACSISEDITPYADYTLGSVSKLYCKFTQWSDGDKNPIRQMTAGAGGNTLNYNASFTYKFMNNWYINGTEYITFNSTTGMKRGTVNNLTSLTYSFDLTTGIVTDSNNVTYEYDNTNDTFTVNGNTYTKTTNPQLKTLHIDLHDSGGSMQDYHGQGSIGVVNVTTPEDGTVQMYVVYGYDLKRSDYDFKIAPGQSITFNKVFATSYSITFTKTSGTCTYTSALLSDGLRIDFSDISTDCELRIVLPVNNAAGQNGDYVLDCGWNETGCTWSQGWNLTAAPLMGHGNMISDNYILGNRGCESADYDASKMMYYCIESVQPVYENTVVFTGATVSQVDIDADNGEGYVTFNVVNNTIQFDDGDYWYIKNLITSTGKASSITITDPNGNTQSYSITNPEAPIAEYIRECAGTWTVNVDSVFPYAIPDLSGRRFGNAENEESWYFTAQNAVHYQNGCGEGATSVDLNITAWVWDPNGWPQNCWNIQTDDNIGYYYDPAEDKFYDNYFDYYPELNYDPCNPPQPTEKHIYLCDNSGAHLAEMTNTGSTWNVTGSFTSGMYSVRATVEGEYNDAWFKFYQTQGDNRIFVGAGDDPSFEDIGTYIMIDDILVSFSLVEDQETGYYVVTYQNTAAMTTSMVDTIVNSYIGGFVTGDEISAMGYMTATDISSMGYMTATDISAMSYVDSTSLSAMSYIDQTTLSSMAYVDNTYLSTYMNAVVGDINSILQTI